MNLTSIIVSVILIFWGLYGVVKRRMFAPWALWAAGRYEMEAAKNIPFTKKSQIKNYFIYDSHAVIWGIILILIGVAVIFANQ